MPSREFVYLGEPIKKIDPVEDREFLLSLQKAMLLSLVERKLLSAEQAERAFDLVSERANRK